MADFDVPLIIRGQIIEDYSREFGDRQGGQRFRTPDVADYMDQLVTTSDTLSDLYTLSFDDIVEYLVALGKLLDPDTNRHWRQAFEVSCRASNVSEPVLRHMFYTAGGAYSAERIREAAQARIGIEYLEGWVPTRVSDGRTIEVRAIGARNVQIIAGNVPVVGIMTLQRSAITRSDSIVKLPSNDPLTMSAIARTMIEMAPGHPITRHMTVAYWKGGDESVEERLYQPRHIEKLVAWGGFSSIKHVTKYLQPGIDLVTLDPKSSMTLVGKEAFADDDTMAQVAQRVAVDMAGLDQEACSNARVIFIETGSDDAGVKMAQKFGRLVYDAVQNLPPTISSGPRTFNPVLKSEINALLQQRDFFDVITDPRNMEKTGAVIVSLHGEQVDFPMLISGRVGNLVPVDDIRDAMSYFSATTQTVGIFPDALRRQLRDRGAMLGGQRFTAVGYACSGTAAAPQDGIEPERRMCRWIVDNDCDPAVVRAPWAHPPASPAAASGVCPP